MNEVLILPEELEFRNKCVEDHERLLARGFPAVSIKFSREGFPAPGYLVAEFRLEGKPMFKICYSPFYHNPKHEDLFEGYTVYGWARLRTLLVEAALDVIDREIARLERIRWNKRIGLPHNTFIIPTMLYRVTTLT